MAKRENLKLLFRKLALFVFNPRFLLCFGIAWIITNGWSYIMLAIGVAFKIEWMIAVAGAYLAFLWLPVSPEKIVTVAIALALLRLIFPKDEKTLGLLKELQQKAKAKISFKKNKKNENDGQSNEQK